MKEWSGRDNITGFEDGGGGHEQKRPLEEQPLEAGRGKRTELPERNAALWTS